MSDIQYNIQLDNLCNRFTFGRLVGEPNAIPGGLLHRMYSIKTTKGQYAVKALNPQIMLRPVAMENFIHSEQIVSIAARKIPALPSKKSNGSFIQEIDNQFYLVFDWVTGKSLKLNEIKIDHCEKIGEILANIHSTDFSEAEIINKKSDSTHSIDWNYYLQKGLDNSCMWVGLLQEYKDKLYDWNTQANKSASLLSSNMVISHRDLDPKNVMWNKENPIVIDWESAGYINPMQDLIETAIYWSESDSGNVDKEKFFRFISAYKKISGDLQGNWRAVLETGYSGKLGWLEYSLKRSLKIECTDEEEQQMGTDQVIGTINAIQQYENMVTKIENWLNTEI